MAERVSRKNYKQPSINNRRNATMSTILPTDNNNNPIPAVRLKDGGAHAINTAASAARNGTNFDPQTKIISLYATEDVYIKCGGSDVTATNADHFFPKGLYYDLAIGGGDTKQYTHISALRVSANGVVFLSEKE
jgi:hypothetical protein